MSLTHKSHRGTTIFDSTAAQHKRHAAVTIYGQLFREIVFSVLVLIHRFMKTATPGQASAAAGRGIDDQSPRVSISSSPQRDTAARGQFLTVADDHSSPFHRLQTSRSAGILTATATALLRRASISSTIHSHDQRRQANGQRSESRSLKD